jgi:hypothetical protein
VIWFSRFSERFESTPAHWACQASLPAGFAPI